MRLVPTTSEQCEEKHRDQKQSQHGQHVGRIDQPRCRRRLRRRRISGRGRCHGNQNILCPSRYCFGVSATLGQRFDGVVIRRPRTSDVPVIKTLVDFYAGKILLEKNLVTLYEAVQEFWVAERDGEVIGCGALHVMWSDLGEVRTVAVHPKVKGQGVGHVIVDRLLEVARELQLQRVFVLTFETEFFSRHGFVEIEGTPVTAEVFEEMCRSYDTGVAEFLDLSYVKPNILGNSRMLLML
jgi:amino-acid N-acetyltransferase